VNVSSVGHIQAAIDFARSEQIRLVIKNTGHDMSGRNLGAGALSVWTYVSSFLAIKERDEFTASKVFERYCILRKLHDRRLHCVQAREIYDAAFEKGLVVVGGVCDVRNFVLFIHLERKFSNKKIVSRVVRRIFTRRWAFYAQFPPHPTRLCLTPTSTQTKS
jgi:hypothetical protein